MPTQKIGRIRGCAEIGRRNGLRSRGEIIVACRFDAYHPHQISIDAFSEGA